MPNDEDPIQKRVEDCASFFHKSLSPSEPAFVSVHFLCGIPELPGYIRRSSGRAANCKLVELAGHNHNEDEQNRVHRRALLQHVRAFDRKHTLFNLAARISKEKKGDVFLRIEIGATGVEKPFQIEFKSEEGAIHYTITLSREVANWLAPKDESLTYLAATYARASNPFNNPGHDPEDIFAGRFTRARAEVFGRLLTTASPSTLLDSMAESLAGDGDEEKLWNLLNPIQSTVVYTHGIGEEQRRFEIGCFRKDQARGADMARLEDDSQPLVLVFASNFQRQFAIGAINHHFGNGTLEGDIANYLQLISSEAPNALKDELRQQGAYTDEQVKLLEREFEKSIEEIVDLPTQKKRLAALTWWMCLLAQKLFGRIHEGEPLDFWFVAGERAEFADDAAFRLDKLFKDHDRDSLQAPLKNGKIDQQRLNAAVRYLEKEHFPWFHRGRHALLFDVSDKALRPVGLVEITNTSWHQVLDESYKPARDQFLRLPGCAIVFVNGETRDAGLIRVNPLARGLQRIRRIMRLQKAHWHLIGSDERESRLHELVIEAVGADNDKAKEITEICLRVADDPTMGGTLVFAENEKVDFLKLGSPWTFGESLQDRIPLIAHDGATLLFPKEDATKQLDWRYRHLLTPSQTDIGAQLDLQEWSMDYEKGGPLNGVGTRRWSAALTALRKGVRLVVVISQDGGITCWRAARKANRLKALHSVSLPLTGKVEEHKCDFAKGQ